MLVSHKNFEPTRGNSFNESFQKINFIIEALKSKNSRKGKWTDIYVAFTKYNVLEDHAVITALQYVPHFYDLYTQHFIRNEQEFPYFRNLLSSFCASWIKRLYFIKVYPPKGGETHMYNSPAVLNEGQNGL